MEIIQNGQLFSSKELSLYSLVHNQKYGFLAFIFYYSLLILFFDTLYLVLGEGSFSLLIFPVLLISWHSPLRVAIFSAILHMVFGFSLIILRNNEITNMEYLNLVIWAFMLITISLIVAKLRQSQYKLTSKSSEQDITLDLIPDLLLVITKQGEIMGYKIGESSDFDLEENQIRRIIFDGKNHETGASITDIVNKAIETSEIIITEFHLIGNQGFQYYELRATRKSENDALVMIRDVTEEKNAEEKVKEFEMQQQLLLKQDALSQLTTDIIHNFNNILSVIMGNISLLHHNFSEISQEHAVEILKTVVDTSESANKMFRTMLSQLHSDPLLYENIDIHEIITEVTSFMHYLVGKKIQIEQRLNAPQSIVEGNANNLYNALFNLSLNARDALVDGGSIIISTCVRKIEKAPSLFHHPDTEYIRIIIEDNGIGMDDHTLSNIFKPFFTTKGDKGMGLGLSGIFRMVKNHKGYIDVESELGKGTKFIIDLPLII